MSHSIKDRFVFARVTSGGNKDTVPKLDEAVAEERKR